MTRRQRLLKIKESEEQTHRIMREYFERLDLAKRQAALEAEQARQAKELEKQRKEQETQRKEQERQAKQLADHEKRIAKLEFEAQQAREDIDFLTDRIAQLYARKDSLLLLQESTLPGCKTFDSCQKEIITLDNQIYSAQKRLNKAQFTIEQARKEGIGMKKYRIIYREQGQMGWDKRMTGSATAENAEDAKRLFEQWASKPSQYRRTLIRVEEVA